MTDNTNTPEVGSDAMRAVVLDTGSAPAQSKNIDPELKPYMDKILSMDQFADVPGPVRDANPGRKMPPPTVQALPPDMHAALYAQLHAYPPEKQAEMEPKLVRAAMRERIMQNRALTGLGEDALPYHKELASIARDVYDLKRKRSYFQEQLDAVSGYDVAIDPATGERVPQPVPLVQGERRKAYEENIQDLTRHIGLLVKEDGSPGLEAAKRMQESLVSSAQMQRRVDQQRAERAEVLRRAEEINRERRINEQAEALASMRRNGGH